MRGRCFDNSIILFGGDAGSPDMISLTNNTQNLVIGSSASVSNAILSVNSTTQGFLPPKMTTAQKTAISGPTSGLFVYDTTLNQMSYFTGTIWVNL